MDQSTVMKVIKVNQRFEIKVYYLSFGQKSKQKMFSSFKLFNVLQITFSYGVNDFCDIQRQAMDCSSGVETIICLRSSTLEHSISTEIRS
jgi:hypothetical protein